ncbi:MAG TPA: aspartate-semialdehyde dehydrogenase [bacterium]|nr:aspartate-semialdehyde dehydrogenase [bacterium]
MTKKWDVAIVGATGAVGREILAILEERDFPIKKISPYASERSFGATVEFKNQELLITPLTEQVAEKARHELVFFCAGTPVSRLFAPIFARNGAIVIDKSAAFRMDADVPLVVPEVNGHLVKKLRAGHIVANPNCSTIQLVPYLQVLDELYGLRSVVVSTYQSVSGAGQEGIEELRQQTADIFACREAKPAVFTQRIAFNLIPHIDKFNADGYTEEEKKLINETRKILGKPDLDIDCTAVRVPVFYGHAEAVTADLERPADLTQLRSALEERPEFALMDDFEQLLYPTPADAAGKDTILVGRLRYGRSGTDRSRVDGWVVADNIRKGAALNGIQIAEVIIGKERS